MKHSCVPNRVSTAPHRRSATQLRRALMNTVLSVALVVSGPGAPTVVIAQQVDYLPVVESLIDRMETTRQQLDRSVFDLSELSFELSVRTPEELLAWVQDAIVFEQYRGLLRGAHGTLLSRAGNALDQAVLLATLVRDAGYDARIVRGRLSTEDAAALVLQMGKRRPVLPPLQAGERAALVELREAARGAAATYPGLGQNTSPTGLPFAELSRRATAAAEVVLERLDELGVGAPQSALPWLKEEAREYFWVEYRDGPSDRWQGAHPAFVSAAAPSSLEPLEYFSEEIPAHHQHRLRIDITIEQKLGDRLVTHVLLDGWERPVANLHGVALTFANVPWSFGAWEDLGDSMRHVARNGVFVPVFLGAAASGQAFDTDGNVVSLAAASNAAAALFRTLGGEFERAAAALDALGGSPNEDPDDFRALTAQWIDYTLIAPAGEERTFRRAVLDRIGPEARAAGRVEIGADRAEFLPLLGFRSAMVGAGGVPAAFAVDRWLETFSETRPALEQLARQAADFQPEMLFPDKGGVPPESLRPLELFQRVDLNPRTGAIVYRAEPALAVFGESFRGAGDEYVVEQYMDVVQNAQRILVAADEGELLQSLEEAVRAGVWDTVLEQTLLDRDLIQRVHFNAIDHIDSALRNGHDLVVLRPADLASGAPAAYGPEAAAAIARDLDAGYSIIVPPPQFTDRGGRTAWWRVHPSSGETLGIISDGRGGALDYRVLGLIAAGLIGFLAMSGYKREKCLEQVQGQAGANLELQDPREYERLVAQCGIGFKFWGAYQRLNDELDIHEERCETNPMLPMAGVCEE